MPVSSRGHVRMLLLFSTILLLVCAATHTNLDSPPCDLPPGWRWVPLSRRSALPDSSPSDGVSESTLVAVPDVSDNVTGERAINGPLGGEEEEDAGGEENVKSFENIGNVVASPHQEATLAPPRYLSAEEACGHLDDLTTEETLPRERKKRVTNEENLPANLTANLSEDLSEDLSGNLSRDLSGHSQTRNAHAHNSPTKQVPGDGAIDNYSQDDKNSQNKLPNDKPKSIVTRSVYDPMEDRLSQQPISYPIADESHARVTRDVNAATSFKHYAIW